MALQITTNINVDFYDKKYIMVNAKQLDSSSRWIAVTCYNQGNLYNISANKHSAYIKWKKADENAVLNSCRINHKGEILIELTEQMLAVDGICYVDLIIVNRGSAIVNIDTGEIITIDNSQILSTQAFCVNVHETYVDHSVIESSYEYNALNDLLEKANADYTEVIMLSKSYAIGNADDIRENEDFDNSKYYCEQAAISADKAKTSEVNAATSETNAKTSETNSKISETNAATSETNAATSEANAKTSETNSATSETNAATSETNAYNYSVTAQRYAVGGTGIVSNEDVDNAKYYYQQVKGIQDSLSGTFSPQGTISFEELSTADKFSGYLYLVNESFTTDETFADGEGIQYPAGTIVYYTDNGCWDCLDTFIPNVATVNEVKSYLSI